jgi:hypothetical protein
MMLVMFYSFSSVLQKTIVFKIQIAGTVQFEKKIHQVHKLLEKNAAGSFQPS